MTNLENLKEDTNMTNHTKEPWRLNKFGGVVSGPDDSFSSEIRVNGFTLTNTDRSIANSRRIVECVNACEGVDNPMEEIPNLLSERNECVDYIRALERCIIQGKSNIPMRSPTIERLLKESK